MKEFTGIQLTVIKAIEKSMAHDKAKLDRIIKEYEKKLKRLEDSIAELKGKYTADVEILELSIERSAQAIMEYTGGLKIDELVSSSPPKEVDDFDSVFGEEEEDDGGDEPFKNIFSRK